MPKKYVGMYYIIFCCALENIETNINKMKEKIVHNNCKCNVEFLRVPNPTFFGVWLKLVCTSEKDMDRTIYMTYLTFDNIIKSINLANNMWAVNYDGFLDAPLEIISESNKIQKTLGYPIYCKTSFERIETNLEDTFDKPIDKLFSDFHL